jgi:vitamin K-dependent gamma-carboxylase
MPTRFQWFVNTRRRLETALFTPSDLGWLCAFRVLYGLAMCISMLRFIGYGWIDEYFVRPRFHFSYWGFSWVEPLSRSSMYGLAWMLAVLALAVAAGFCFRISALLFVIGFTYLQLIDVATYLNHYYLASLLGLLLAIAPANRAASIDALLRPGIRRKTAASLWLYLFRFQVGVVYTFAGLAKANADWLFRAQPLSIWLGSHTDMPVLGPLFAQDFAPYAMSWAGFLFDTTIAWWLLFSMTRPFAFLAVIAFHSLTSALFPIGMFPVIMVLSALVFFPPDWPGRLLAKLRAVMGRKARHEQTLEPVSPIVASPRLRSFALVLAAVYCVFQLVFPLRFLAYGGDVRWHEQGMRFSWRVMIREKNGSITYVVRQKETGRTWHVSPRAYLTSLQAREMSGQPDLILQLAHHIREDFARRGHGSVEVRVDALVSLNGRRIARLIDPDVDLVTVRDGFGKASWILDAPRESAPLIRRINAT